jgi:hypothetical protein
MTPGADPRSNSQWVVVGKVNPFQAEEVDSSHGGVRLARRLEGKHAERSQAGIAAVGEGSEIHDHSVVAQALGAACRTEAAPPVPMLLPSEITKTEVNSY